MQALQNPGATWAAGTQAIGINNSGTTRYAVVWDQGSPTILNPNSNWTNCNPVATDGLHQVGFGMGSIPTGNKQHAMLWAGTPESAVDLHPSGFVNSVASGVSGTQQAGHGVTTSTYHALLWSGTAESVVDLNPAGSSSSYALSTNGTQQVGQATWHGGQHAVFWNGSADTAVDLHPAWFNYSTARGTCGTQQVGDGELWTHPLGWPEDPARHALLWNGTADSAVDLNPAGFVASYAYGTNGRYQVGEGTVAEASTYRSHALLWSGSAGSFVDLHTLLPAGYTSSRAYSVDLAGNVYGLAWGPNNTQYAVVWSAVPEPASLALLALGGVCLFRRRSQG